MRDDRFSIDIPKRWLRRAVIAAAVGLLVLPAAGWASDTFTDVPDDDSENGIFHDDINWMEEEGVTRGCNPPENTQYCPEEPVLRRQMAAFLHRMDTEDVFVTPEEMNAAAPQVHFAVINDDGEVIASDGLEDAESTATDDTGTYDIDFATDVSDCSWTGTVGDRDDDTPVPNANVTLNDTDDDSVIRAIVTDGNGTAIPEDFNVTVNC